MSDQCTNCNKKLATTGKRQNRYCKARECQRAYRKELHRGVVPTAASKWCNQCQTHKPGRMFTIDRRTSDGRRSSCKACTYEYMFLYGRGQSTSKIKRSVRAEIGYIRYLAILKRDEYNCQLCSEPVTAVYDPIDPPTEAEYYEDTACNIDHIIPRCTGGQSTDENLQVTHRKCNGQKGRIPGTTLRPQTAEAQEDLRILTAA